MDKQNRWNGQGFGYEEEWQSYVYEMSRWEEHHQSGGRFTNTAVPRFNRGGCWQQHLQTVQAIVKSNGWTDGTAALQLFAHLDGEALNVALLMPEEERAKWEEGLSQGLSDYYNSPGRLAAFRRQFESATRRPGMDLATFAT